MNIVESFAKQSNRPLNAAAFQFLRMLWPEGIGLLAADLDADRRCQEKLLVPHH